MPTALHPPAMRSPVLFPALEVRTGAFAEEFRRLADDHDWARVAVITGPRVRRSVQLDDRLHAIDHLECRVWTTGATHAPFDRVEDLAREFSDWTPDVILSIGGGSCHDFSKGIATLMDRGGRLFDHCLRFEPPDRLEHQPLPGQKVPIVTVPSTLSGSEGNGAAGFTDPETGRKRVIADPSLFPVAVIVDSAVLATTPAPLFHGSMMNSLNHAVEGLASRRRNAASEALLSKAFAELALAVEPGSPEDRERASIASVLAGVGLSGSWLGLAHAVGHVIGGRFRVPHGWCHAVMAGPVVRFNAPVAGAEHAVTAELVGARPDSDGLADWLDARATAWDLPRRLRDLGIGKADLPGLADAAWRDHDSYYNPRRATQQDIAELLGSVW